MAFVVETGTGIANANSYSSVAAADAYFADRGVTAWVGTDLEKQGWLVQATDYVDARFGSLFLGTQQYPTVQALQFPRLDALGVVIPMVNLLKAVAEYALRAKAGSLAPDPTADATGLQVKSKMSKVGPIEEETVYSDKAAGVLRAYPAADMLLRSLVRRGGGVIRG